MSRAANSSIVIVLASLAGACLPVHASAAVTPDAAERDDRITMARKCVDERGAEVSGAKIRLFRSHRQDRGSAIVEMVNATKSDEEGSFRFRDIRVAIENSDADETITHYLVIMVRRVRPAARRASRSRSPTMEPTASALRRVRIDLICSSWDS